MLCRWCWGGIHWCCVGGGGTHWCCEGGGGTHWCCVGGGGTHWCCVVGAGKGLTHFTFSLVSLPHIGAGKKCMST